MTHICVSKLNIIGSDNGLSPGRRQAIIWTNAGILLIGALGTNVSEFVIKICTFSLKKKLLKMSSGKRRPSCLGFNVLTGITDMCWQHDSCRWPGTKLVPGHQQQPCWLDCAYSVTLITPCITHTATYILRWDNYIPRFNEVDRGVYWYHLVRLSVCPSVDRIVSTLYLQQYSSDPFHICTSYQATSEGVSRVMPVSKFINLKFWRIFKFRYFDFVIFWLGIQYDLMVWVIMRRRGVSSECRRSSCSS